MKFVRIDKRLDSEMLEKNDFIDHVNYLKTVAKERFFLGGGFVDEPGGMIVFEANSREEAEKIAREDPIIARGFYNYTLHQWKILLS